MASRVVITSAVLAGSFFAGCLSHNGAERPVTPHAMSAFECTLRVSNDGKTPISKVGVAYPGGNYVVRALSPRFRRGWTPTTRYADERSVSLSRDGKLSLEIHYAPGAAITRSFDVLLPSKPPRGRFVVPIHIEDGGRVSLEAGLRVANSGRKDIREVEVRYPGGTYVISNLSSHRSDERLVPLFGHVTIGLKVTYVDGRVFSREVDVMLPDLPQLFQIAIEDDAEVFLR